MVIQDLLFFLGYDRVLIGTVSQPGLSMVVVPPPFFLPFIIVALRIWLFPCHALVFISSFTLCCPFLQLLYSVLGPVSSMLVLTVFYLDAVAEGERAKLVLGL